MLITEMTLRRASMRDCIVIADLSGQLGYPSTPDAIAERLTIIKRNSHHVVFVAERNNGIVGWVHVAKELHLESGTFGEVIGLVVDESHRRAGIGRCLVEAAEQWVQERGCREMRVRTNVVRERTHAFYERNGYGMKKQQKVFWKPLNK